MHRTSRFALLFASIGTLALILSITATFAESPVAAVPTGLDTVAIDEAAQLAGTQPSTSAVESGEVASINDASDVEGDTCVAKDDEVDTKVFTATQGARPMRGYCRCSCSFTPDCSTNADCGGGLCLKGPTCC